MSFIDPNAKNCDEESVGDDPDSESEICVKHEILMTDSSEDQEFEEIEDDGPGSPDQDQDHADIELCMEYKE